MLLIVNYPTIRDEEEVAASDFLRTELDFWAREGFPYGGTEEDRRRSLLDGVLQAVEADPLGVWRHDFAVGAISTM